MSAEHALLPRKTLANTGIELTVFGVGGYLGLLPDEHAPRVACEQAAVLAVRRAVDPGEVAMQYSVRNASITSTLAGPRTADEVEANLRHLHAVLPEGLWGELYEFLATLGPAPSGGEAY